MEGLVYETLEKVRYSHFISEHNNCALCGHTLDLNHILNEERTQIKEEARCSQCDMRARNQFFSIQ